MNLRLLIVRAARGLSIEGAHTAFHRAPGLVERLRPGSAHLHDLRPIDEAVPSEHDELGLSVAPAMQGRGQEVALLGAVPSLALHQTLGPAQPPPGAPSFSAREQAKPQPERGSGRGQALSRLAVRVI